MPRTSLSLLGEREVGRDRGPVIERYARAAMSRVWTDANKFARWLDVEKAAVRGWAQVGEIPAEDADQVERATIEEGRIAEYLVEMHHDMTAFLRSVAD